MDGTSDGPWAGTGLDACSSQVLEYLLSHPSADSRTVSTAVGASSEATQRALRSLEDALLAVRTDDRPPRWTAGPPRSSLGQLLARKRRELAQAELYMEQLNEIYQSVSLRRSAQLIEVMEHQEEVSARYAYLLKGSTREVLHLSKPPYVSGSGTARASGDTGSAQPAVQPGVRLRSVYDTDGFTDAVSLETALRGTAIGGEFRLSTPLPLKLVVFDRTAALLPLHGDRPSAGSLLVHSPALIDAVAALFENIWERAAPASLESRGDWPFPHPPYEVEQIDERTREILRLMATGMKDDSIARVLNVSRRTVQKHISEAGSTLGVRTRFQMALLAAERGWLGSRPA
ncbi:helix-turn-helix transcriptional regulator [Actinacidiphila rubida]|uniref:Regulatory protein, luxR family n=1 Tax=Actinacidiphila rubida TaxID=310780 RepID=A0A1H8SL86_9ACTN|nr:TrmB family transcriptional regulator [Actinacidiphila rubida]SEO78963.1 regulatory protein, luxR family [Actinacidiphila rubida]